MKTDTRELKELINELENITQHLNIPSVEPIYDNRIFNRNLDEELSSIPSDLQQSGKLRRSISISTHAIVLLDYYRALESLYGAQIFGFSDLEIDKIEDNLWNVLNR